MEVGGWEFAWSTATNTSSNTPGGESCGSPKVFVCMHVCVKERNSTLPVAIPFVSSHVKLQAIINHSAGFIVWFTAHAQRLSSHAVAGRVPFD